MFHALGLALALFTAMSSGEVQTITLKQAVDMAFSTSPEMRIAQAQEEAAKQSIADARSSFIPAFYIGSGAAYTRGALQQIEGQPPAIAQAYAVSQIFNLPQKYAIRELQATAMAASVTALSQRDELVWRVASTYLDLDRAARTLEAIRAETASLEKLQALTLERVKEGQEIPSEGTRARLGVARNRQRVVELEGRVSLLESTLKSMLSMPEDRHIRTVPDSVPAGAAFDSADAEKQAIARAIDNSFDLKRLRHELEAKEARVRAEESQKYPQVELIAEYALQQQIFRFESNVRTTPNNVQLGTSIKIPLFAQHKIGARVGVATAELNQVRAQIDAARRRIAIEVRQIFQQSRQAGANKEVARLELELARESTGVMLARFQEGRAGARELEQARLEESGHWNTLLDSGFELDRAHLQLLRATGEILTVLQ